ncbi:MAG: double-strand break repair helicase AddA, partial [Alphaproteobacteria bacterium]|nr:double-strand break repair helicase AddA [Alphaproteobacteria bacterium]
MTNSPHPAENIIFDDDLPADTNARQRLATDPDLSVWVSASAGTGKTSVLTRRVLRLLLPREDGRPGTLPGRILCLTFTKAAASEMKLRLTQTLALWATLPLIAASPANKSLTTELGALLGRAPRDHEVMAARRLFAAVVDTPGGLRIMTIHAFCTALLGAFPLEAGLPPQFKTLEEAPAAALMTKARNDVLTGARLAPHTDIARALDSLAGALSEDAFNELLQEIAKERQQVRQNLEEHAGPDGLYRALCAQLGLSANENEASILMDTCAGVDEAALRNACTALAESSSAGDQERGIGLQAWLDSDVSGRADEFEAYTALFLTSTGEVRKRLAVKAVGDKNPAALEAMQVEAERIVSVRERLNAAHCAAMTGHLFTVGSAILARYQALKEARAALDFDDLILRTLQLLRAQHMVPWVMFKLDGGIDHILVDEAQDTNPEQWEIIRLLAADFFSGSGAREDVRRTIFAVGDEKQSIYSFQRAAPEKFTAMRTLFRGMVMAAGLPWRDIPLDMSFRTVSPVLRLVDETFAPEATRAGMGSAALKHYSHRADHGGLAEIWPLFISPKEDKESLWDPPVAAGESHRAAAHMARHISATIKAWLDPAKPEMLASKGRPIRPGDIMILVRTRTAFVNQLIRALKVAGIPVGGVDRMVLAEQLVVRDLMAVAQFALLPGDDLTLACVLKSPFIGWTDQDLEGLAAYRHHGESLWQALQTQKHSLVAWLSAQRDHAAHAHPFEFFSRLVQEPCPADAISGQHAITGRLGVESLDPLEEFLSAALAFETDNIAALQDFVLYMGRAATTVKREQEEAGNNVRIMTVHGAKGLQAPVVILPDTIRPRRGGNRQSERLLWPEKADIPLPLWASRSDRECAPYSAGKQVVQDRMDEEYRRLLYVAMTRAEDRLYVTGFRNHTKHIADSWYDYIESAISRLSADVRPVPFTYPDVLDAADRNVTEAQQMLQPQKAPAFDKAPAHHTAATATARRDDEALHW